MMLWTFPLGIALILSHRFAMSCHFHWILGTLNFPSWLILAAIVIRQCVAVSIKLYTSLVPIALDIQLWSIVVRYNAGYYFSFPVCIESFFVSFQICGQSWRKLHGLLRKRILFSVWVECSVYIYVRSIWFLFYLIQMAFFPGLSIGESGVLKPLAMTVLAGSIYGFISKIVSLCNWVTLCLLYKCLGL